MGRNERKRRELIGDTSSSQISWLRAAGMATDTVVLGAALLLTLAVMLSVATVWHLSAGMLLLSPLLIVLCSQLSRPAFWKRIREIHADRTPPLPDPLQFRDPMVGALVQRLARARQARSRAREQSPYGAHHALLGSAGAIGELERRAVVIAARAEFVSGFLAEASDGGIPAESEVARLRSSEQSARCVEASAAYGRAASWSVDRAESIRRLEARRATLVGTLEHLAAVLEALPAKVTDLELRRIEEGDHLIGVDTTESEMELMRLD
jgi:hypothetical protein